MTTVKFSITHNYSSSKGWGRYRATVDGRKLVESNTGNEWVSADHYGDAPDGATITVRLQTMQRVGKSGTRRERIDDYDYQLITREGASCTLGFWQGLEVEVLGAEVIA